MNPLHLVEGTPSPPIDPIDPSTSVDISGVLTVTRPSDRLTLGTVEVRSGDAALRAVRFGDADAIDDAGYLPQSQMFPDVGAACAWVQSNPKLPVFDPTGWTWMQHVWGVPLWSWAGYTIFGCVRQTLPQRIPDPRASNRLSMVAMLFYTQPTEGADPTARKKSAAPKLMAHLAINPKGNFEVTVAGSKRRTVHTMRGNSISAIDATMFHLCCRRMLQALGNPDLLVGPAKGSSAHAHAAWALLAQQFETNVQRFWTADPTDTTSFWAQRKSLLHAYITQCHEDAAGAL